LNQGENTLNAQEPQTFEIGVHGGASYYIGDINPSKHFADCQMQLGGVFRFNYNPRWTYRLDYTHATVRASDEKIKFRPERKLGFCTVINDISALVEFNFFDYYIGSPRRSFSPYIFGGLSAYSAEIYNYECSIILRGQKTEDVEYGKFGISVPFGFGVKISIMKHLGLTFEWRLHKTFNDYLDDVSGLYPEKDPNGDDGINIDSDPTGIYQAKMQRGDSSNDDWYSIVGASLTWRFNVPKRESCNLKF
jgi:hypothetical protein